MANRQDWIAKCIKDAKILHPFVTEAVSDQMLTLLQDQLTNVQLSKTEQASISKELIPNVAFQQGFRAAQAAERNRLTSS